MNDQSVLYASAVINLGTSIKLCEKCGHHTMILISETLNCYADKDSTNPVDAKTVDIGWKCLWCGNQEKSK